MHIRSAVPLLLASIAAVSPALAQTEITPPGSAVTASTDDGNVPANAVDNNLGTRWSANGDGAWLQLDLGSVRSVGSVRVAVYRGNERRNRFDLQTAVTAGSWTTVFAGESSGTTTLEQPYDFPDVDARYVRYVGHMNNVNTFNSVTEISVFAGTAATPTATATATATSTPTATSATASPTPTATSVSATNLTPAASAVTASTNDGNVPGNTVDGNLATRWSGSGDGAWIQYDLGSSKTIAYVRIAAYNGNARQNRFDLEVATSPGAWQRVLTGGTTSGTTTQLETQDITDVNARYLRYIGHGSTAGTFNSVTELQIWGGACTSCPTPTSTPTATATATRTATPTATNPPSGTVYFQNTGIKSEWPNYPQVPQNKGKLDEVSSPTYKGSTALRFEQTYVQNASERFHTEVTYHHSQENGQDRYYGFAMYLPTTWHNESMKDNFQQWGTENPGGPWLIMHIDQDHLRAGHPNTIPTTDYGPISKGVWHTTVARLRMANNVPFEFWVDGVKKGSTNCTCSATGGSVRWSAGLYISYWYDKYRSGLPSGSQTVRYLYQDHYRIASTYTAADPASW
jgi:hypothetical protein